MRANSSYFVIFFRELGIRKPDRFLKAAESTAAETIGRVKAAMLRLSF